MNPRRCWPIVGLLALVALAAGALAPLGASAAPGVYFTRYYGETGHNLMMPFLKYWDQQGGLPVFGYPKSEAFLAENEGHWYAVQWFERQRLEHHPEHAYPYHILLGRLGAEALAAQGRDWT